MSRGAFWREHLKAARSISAGKIRAQITRFGAILSVVLFLGASFVPRSLWAAEMTGESCSAGGAPRKDVEAIRAASRKTLCHFDLTESMKKSLRCLSDTTDSFTTRYQPLEAIESEISRCYRSDIVPQLEKDPVKRKKLEEQVKSETENLKTIAVSQMAEKLQEVERQIDLKQTVGIPLTPDENKWLADLKKRIEASPAAQLASAAAPVPDKPAPSAEQLGADLERAGVHLDKSGLSFGDFPFNELKRPDSRQSLAIQQAFGSRSAEIIAGINELYTQPRKLGPNEFGTRRVAFAIGNSVIVPGRWPDMRKSAPRVMSIDDYNRKVKNLRRDFDDEIRKSREAAQAGAGFWASMWSSSIQKHSDDSIAAYTKANDILVQLKLDYGVETKLGDRMLETAVKAMGENSADSAKVIDNLELAQDATIGVGVTFGVIATGGMLAGPVLGLSGTSVVVGMTSGVVAGVMITGGIKAVEAVVGSYDMSDALCRSFSALTQGMATSASIPGISTGTAVERIKKSYEEGGALGLMGHLMSLGPTQAVLGLVTPGFTKLLARAGTPVVSGTLTALGKSAPTILKSAGYSGKLAQTAVTVGFAAPTLPGAVQGVNKFIDRQVEAAKLGDLESKATNVDDKERYSKLAGSARQESYQAILEAAAAIGPAAFPHLLHPINSATTRTIETVVAKLGGGRTPAEKLSHFRVFEAEKQAISPLQPKAPAVGDVLSMERGPGDSPQNRYSGLKTATEATAALGSGGKTVATVRVSSTREPREFLARLDAEIQKQMTELAGRIPPVDPSQVVLSLAVPREYLNAAAMLARQRGVKTVGAVFEGETGAKLTLAETALIDRLAFMDKPAPVVPPAKAAPNVPPGGNPPAGPPLVVQSTGEGPAGPDRSKEGVLGAEHKTTDGKLVTQDFVPPGRPSAELRAFRQKMRAEYEADIKLYAPDGASPNPTKYQAALQNRAHIGRILRDVARFRKELRAAGVDMTALKSGIVISDVGKSPRAMKEIIERAIRERFPKKDGQAWTEGDYFAAFLNHEKYGLDLLEGAGLHPDESKMVREAIIGHNGPGTADSWWGINWKAIMGGEYQSIQAKEGFVHAVVDRVDGAIAELAPDGKTVVGGMVKILHDEWNKAQAMAVVAAAERAAPPVPGKPPTVVKTFAEMVQGVVGSTDSVQGQLKKAAELAIEMGNQESKKDPGLVNLFTAKDGFFASQQARLGEMKALMDGPNAAVKLVEGPPGTEVKVMVDGVQATDAGHFFELLAPVLKRGVRNPPEHSIPTEVVARPPSTVDHPFTFTMDNPKEARSGGEGLVLPPREPPSAAVSASRDRVPDFSSLGSLQNVGRRKPIKPEYWAYKFVQELNGIPHAERVQVVEGLNERLKELPNGSADAVFLARVLEGLHSPQAQEKLMRDSGALVIEGTGLLARKDEDHGIRTAVERAVSDLVWSKRSLKSLKFEQSFDDVTHSYVDQVMMPGRDQPGVKPKVAVAIERSVVQAQEWLRENGISSKIAGYHEDASLGRVPYLEVTGGGETRLGRMIAGRQRINPNGHPDQSHTRFLFDPYDSLTNGPTSHRDPRSNILYLSGRSLAKLDGVLPGVQGELAALRFQHDLSDSQARAIEATIVARSKEGGSVKIADSVSTVAKVTKAFSSVGGLEREMGGMAEPSSRLIGSRFGHEGAAVETSARVEAAQEALETELTSLRSAQKQLARSKLGATDLEAFRREGTLTVQVAGAKGVVQDVVIRWQGANRKGDLAAVQGAVAHRINMLKLMSERLDVAAKRAGKLEDLASGVHDDAPLAVPESIHRSWKERVKSLKLPGIDVARILKPRVKTPRMRSFNIPKLIETGQLDAATIQAYTTYQGDKPSNALHGELVRFQEGDLIVDSNIAIYLARVLEPSPHLKASHFERLKGFFARSPRRILVTDVSALEVVNHLSASTVEGFQLPGIQLKIKTRSEKSYQRILEQLNDKPAEGAGKAVGGNNGTQDRIIVADLFFARREGNIAPSFLTADHGIYTRLFQLAKLSVTDLPTRPDALAEYIRTQYPDGFLCTLNDGKGNRTIRVIPAPEPAGKPRSPEAPRVPARAVPDPVAVKVESNGFFATRVSAEKVPSEVQAAIHAQAAELDRHGLSPMQRQAMEYLKGDGKDISIEYSAKGSAFSAKQRRITFSDAGDRAVGDVPNQLGVILHEAWHAVDRANNHPNSRPELYGYKSAEMSREVRANLARFGENAEQAWDATRKRYESVDLIERRVPELKTLSAAKRVEFVERLIQSGLSDPKGLEAFENWMIQKETPWDAELRGRFPVPLSFDPTAFIRRLLPPPR